MITEIIEGSPAATSTLKVGDEIFSVKEEDISNNDEESSLILGMYRTKPIEERRKIQKSIKFQSRFV